MSRPILSRPRTRVYGCNYDKGESYYKPMVDHLDRKYSSRPLFSEPRNSFADEIAARRSDIGSRNLGEAKIDAEDDLEYVFNGLGRAIPDDDIEDDFVSSQRKFKERAANAFEEDLAELRRKRRDIQDRMFDMIDIGAEINRAKSSLETSNKAFEKHAKKFDNQEEPEIEPKNLVERLEKARKLKKLSLIQENPDIEGKIKTPMMKWCTFVELDNEMPKMIGEMTKARIRNEAPINIDGTPMIINDKIKSSSTEKRRTKKRSALKKKKLVSL